MAKMLCYVPKNLNPLDVHETGDGNHRVCDPSHLWHPWLGAVSTKYHRLQGDVLPTAGEPIFIDKEEDIVIATNSTVKDG